MWIQSKKVIFNTNNVDYYFISCCAAKSVDGKDIYDVCMHSEGHDIVICSFENENDAKRFLNRIADKLRALSL